MREFFEDSNHRLSSKRLVGIVGSFVLLILVCCVVYDCIKLNEFSTASGLINFSLAAFLALLGGGSVLERLKK